MHNEYQYRITLILIVLYSLVYQRIRSNKASNYKCISMIYLYNIIYKSLSKSVDFENLMYNEGQNFLLFKVYSLKHSIEFQRSRHV